MLQEIYTQATQTLSAEDRLRLATLLLNDLVLQEVAVIDRSDVWSEGDRVDLAAFSWQYAATAYLESSEMLE